MKKKLSSWLQLLILLFGIFVPSFASTPSAEAKEVAGVITSLNLSNDDGGPLRDGYDIWQQFRINATFVLPNNTVNEGDTTTITLPAEIAFAVSNAIQLKDPDGNVVANATIDEDRKTITLTYTNYAESKSNVTGNFFFYGRVDHNVIQSEQDINITLDIQGNPVNVGQVHYNGPPGKYDSKLDKAGWQDNVDSQKLKYELAINRNMEVLTDLVVSDQLLDPGLELIPDSFQVLSLDWAWNNGTWAQSNHKNITSQFNIQISPDKRSFTIDLGTLNSKGLLINYDVRLPYEPVDGEVFKNEANLESNGNIIRTDLVSVTYFVAGGSAEGYLYSIDITKTDEQGAPLKGAVFEVVRDRNSAVVATITSDDNGKAVANGLLKDNYTIREITAPTGYKPLANTIAVSPDDFGTTKVASLTIKNEKEEQPQKVTFSKVNLGGEEIAGAEIKIYKGLTATGTPVESFTSVANQSKELTLLPGEYTFHEEAAPTGYLAVTDITFRVNADGTVTVLDTNSNAVEYKDGKLVITDQYDTTPKKVTFSKVNLGGEEIAGAEIKIYKGLTATGTPVESFTSVANQSKELTLLPGEYTFHEEAAPTGYLAVTDITFRVNADGTVTVLDTNSNAVEYKDGKLVITDQYDTTPKKVTFSKVNLGGEEIAGAQIQIFDEQQTKVEEWTSEANTSKVIDLKPGKYVFHEEAAPNGYLAVTDITFQVNYDGTVTVLDTNSNAVEYKDGKLVITDQIVNTHQVAKTSVSGQKTWSDHDNQDGVRPDEITVNLLADGKKVDSKTVTAKDGWKYEFNDLDKFKAGQEIKYTVEEAAVAGYETTYDGNNIVNTHQVAKTSVSGQKTWLDNNDQDGNRPDSITLHLLANGKEVATKAVTAKDDWKYEFNDLDKYSAGKKIVYTITEDQVNDYNSDVSDAKNIVNKYTPGKTSATVTKAWQDADNQDGLRTSIKVQLYANDKAYGDPVELTSDTGWTYTWNDLNQRQNHKDVKYTVKEVNTPDGYVAEVNSEDQGNLIITNTHKVAKTSVSGQKTWSDHDNQDGVRPDEITVNLLADGKKVDSKTVTAKDGWKYEFNDLDKFKAGQEIKYTVEEAAVAGYETTYDGNNIVNTHQVAKTSVSGQKTWLDNNDQDGNRPDSITLHLLANGKEVATKAVTAKDDWKYEFNDLDKYSAGKKIVYTITEDQVNDYNSDVSDAKNIVNKYTPGKTSATVTKAWQDADNQDGLRTSIKVQLYANDKAYGDPVELTSDTGWTYTWNDLNQRQNHKDVKYTVKEVNTPDGYVAEVNSEDQGNLIITNTHKVAKTSVSGQKTWSDHDNQDGVRPDEITVNLLADGKKVDSKTVTAKDGWKYEFNDLDKFKAGQEIKYSISEDKVTGYKTTVSGYDLTNILNESSIPVKNQSINQGTPKNPKHQGSLESILPATGVLSSKNFVISGLVFILFALSSLGYVFIKRRHND